MTKENFSYKGEIVGSKGREKLKALFDSGATYSCIQGELAEELEIVIPLPQALVLRTAKEGESLRADKRVTLDFYLNGYRFSDEFIVIPNLSEKVIIGAKTLQAWRLKLDFENDEIK